MWFIYAVCVLLVFGVSGCAATTTPLSEVRLPVPIVQECHDLDYGVAPDLTDLANLKATDDPQHIISVINATLFELAKDDAKIRAMHIK
jgi:hypothetical protein